MRISGPEGQESAASGYIIHDLSILKSIPLPSIFCYCFCLGAAIAILISVSYLEIEEENHGEFYALLLFSVVGMMCMAAGIDIVLLFIGLELMAISIYVLVGFLRRDRRSNEAALEISAARSILVGHFCLRPLAVLWDSGEHQPSGYRARSSGPASQNPAQPYPDSCATHDAGRLAFQDRRRSLPSMGARRL